MGVGAALVVVVVAVFVLVRVFVLVGVLLLVGVLAAVLVLVAAYLGAVRLQRGQLGRVDLRGNLGQADGLVDGGLEALEVEGRVGLLELPI